MSSMVEGHYAFFQTKNNYSSYCSYYDNYINNFNFSIIVLICLFNKYWGWILYFAKIINYNNWIYLIVFYIIWIYSKII